MQNLFNTFQAGFFDSLDRPLLITPEGDAYTYADAVEQSARLAHFLSGLGLVPGDRVTVQAPKSPQSVWLYLACLRGGFIYHPLNDAYQPKELEYFVADAEPSLIVCSPQQIRTFSALTGANCRVLTMDATGSGSLAADSAMTSASFGTLECGPDGVAVLLYSSGTTGKPKGVTISHGNLATNTEALVATWGFSATDRLLHTLPIYHAHGLFVALSCVLMSGASMIFLPGFDVDGVIKHLHNATVMMGVPTFYTRLLNNPAFDRTTCAAIRLFISGSAPLSPETHEKFLARTGHAILERYGMTETLMNSSNPLDGERRPGSVGLPLPGISIRIADAGDRAITNGDVGEIQVKGPNVFSGYWKMPDKTRQEFTGDGYFRTGDQGTFSDDGYLSIVGRNKDLIISGGLNVYPREVELVIDGLEGVIESAVIGVPHPDFGEGVVAMVETEDGTAAGTEDEIIQAIRNQLANFKIPKRIFFVEKLPRNALGKVQKKVLRQQFAKALT